MLRLKKNIISCALALCVGLLPLVSMAGGGEGGPGKSRKGGGSLHSSGSPSSSTPPPGGNTTGSNSTTPGSDCGYDVPLTWEVVLKLLNHASSQWSIPVGKLVDAYNSGELTITYMGCGWFQVNYDGSTLDILIENI